MSRATTAVPKRSFQVHASLPACESIRAARPQNALHEARNFRSGLTRPLMCFIGANALFASWLTLQGFLVNQTWSGRGNVFIITGLLALLCTIARACFVQGRRLTLSERSLTYEATTGKVTVPWRQCRTFVLSQAGRSWHRTILVGDDTHTVLIDSLSFPDFEAIAALVRDLRERHFEIPEKFRRAGSY